LGGRRILAVTLPERARALAAALSASRTITPFLSDDVATITVIFDSAAILAALEATRREAIEEAVKRGRLFADCIDGEDDWRVPAQSGAYGCLAEIGALIDRPDSEKSATPADTGPQQGGTEG
jgi:hypothetical protein